jgi:hypothetical protein
MELLELLLLAASESFRVSPGEIWSIWGLFPAGFRAPSGDVRASFIVGVDDDDVSFGQHPSACIATIPPSNP